MKDIRICLGLNRTDSSKFTKINKAYLYLIFKYETLLEISKKYNGVIIRYIVYLYCYMHVKIKLLLKSYFIHYKFPIIASESDITKCYDKIKISKELDRMKKTVLNMNIMGKFKVYLYGEERSKATIEKYMRDIMHFYEYLPENDKAITKERLVDYKNSLSEEYKVSSINSMLVALNGLLDYLKLGNLKLKLHKVQRSAFYEEERELTKVEYKRLLDTALKRNDKRLYMLLQTICGTGIRVSEHKYITVEAVKEGKAVVRNKGKTRIVFLPKKLKRLLKDYCKQENISAGSVFVTKSGRPMDRSNIWSAMKKLCRDARVDDKKVFPHNLRHLFALTFYRLQKDVVRLADLLGHASIETTRIYTTITGRECQKSLSKMDLVIALTI